MAHRGFSGKAPENTLAAFQQAIEVGSDFIELDVRFSKDGHPVIFHDDTLERTTNGKGKVADFSLLELKRLDAGSWFGGSFSGEKIPTLREVLGLARGRILVNIELKKGDQGRYTMIDLADRTLEEIQRAGMEAQVLVSSFDAGAIERVRKNSPTVAVAFITGSPWLSAREAFGGKLPPFLNPRKSTLNERNLAKAHQEGVKIVVWTIDTEEEMEKFISMGVDGIITNHPDRLIRVLEKRINPKTQIPSSR
jgi:glycerophosphoryl diester phosphodiesterase